MIILDYHGNAWKLFRLKLHTYNHNVAEEKLSLINIDTIF